MSWTTLPRSSSAEGIAWHESGRGQSLVLLHGVGLRAEAWGRQIEALSGHCRVIVPDLPGHGASAAVSQANPRLSDYTEAVTAFLDQILDAPAIIAGHSMGAMIALDVALRDRGDCAGIAALCGIFRRPPEARAAVAARAAELRSTAGDAVAEAPVARWFGTPVPPVWETAADLCRHWLRDGDRKGYADAYAAFAQADGPCPRSLAQLPVPALFVTGEHDRNSTPAMSRQMAALAPRAEAVIVADAGHMLPMTHADAVNALLDRLLRGAVPTEAETGTGTGPAGSEVA